MNILRGAYKKNTYDPNFKIPKSTFYRHKRNMESPNQILIAKNLCDSSNVQKIVLENNDMEYDGNVENNNVNIIDEMQDPLLNYYDEEELDEEPDEIEDIIKDEIVTKEELAAAFLANFYKGRTSQESLSDYLNLNNIHAAVKLPTTFDGLSKLLMKKTKISKKLEYEKTWFCDTCLKSTTRLENSYQRNCSCNSR